MMDTSDLTPMQVIGSFGVVAQSTRKPRAVRIPEDSA